MYESEKRKLKARIGQPLWDLYKSHKVIVAGGAITSLFCNRDINDIDVYFRSEEMLVRILACFFGKEDYWFEEIDPFSVHVHSLTQRSIMIGAKDNIQQLMWFKYFNTASDIFNSFDFTVCMGAFDFETEEFIFHPEFMKHNSQRYLKFNTGTDFPIMSALRVDKYRQKGYEISKQEMLRVLFQCTQAPIDSWESAKEHIGGMYGYSMDKAFDEDKEFSIPELIEQLGTLDQRDVDLYSYQDPDHQGFYEICEKICQIPEDQSVEKFVPKKGKYYKCVRDNWKSKWSCYRNSIDYNMHYELMLPITYERYGRVWVHPDPNNPNNFLTKYWVELELVDGGSVVIDKDDPAKSHLASGAFMVTDLITREDLVENNQRIKSYLKKYILED